MKNLISAASLFALGAAVCISAPARAQEKIARPDVVVVNEAGGVKQKQGKVESADYEKIAFAEKGGKRSEIAAADVVEIRWSDSPAGYDDGMRALAGGDAAGAAKSFADALREKDVKTSIREWVVEYSNAGLGRAYLMLGQPDKAADAFGLARSANAKSMILDRILLGLAEAELARGKGDAAARAADDLVVAARAAKRTPWELEAQVTKASCKLAAGDFAGAAASFEEAATFAERAAAAEKNKSAADRLRRSAVEASARKGWALVAKAESTKSSADFDAARSYFDGLATKNPNEPLVRACASNAAAVAKLAAGDAKTAVRMFAETEVVHFRAPNEVARAIWYQAECWKKLGDEQRRTDRLKDLKSMFPGTEWARRAQ